jgi:transaldolase
MTTSLQSLIACGTKVWLDTVDPGEVVRNHAWGATGTTSNPLIVADLIKTGRYDGEITR